MARGRDALQAKTQRRDTDDGSTRGIPALIHSFCSMYLSKRVTKGVRRTIIRFGTFFAALAHCVVFLIGAHRAFSAVNAELVSQDVEDFYDVWIAWLVGGLHSSFCFFIATTFPVVVGLFMLPEALSTNGHRVIGKHYQAERWAMFLVIGSFGAFPV